MMSRYILIAFLVLGLIVAFPVRADWVIGGDGSVTRSEVLGDDSEKKEEKQEDKENKKEEKKDEKLKIEMQKDQSN